MKIMGRPVGHGEFAKERQVSKSFRLTVACSAWIEENGGRPYLESLVPKEFRDAYKKLQQLQDEVDTVDNKEII